jgi:hypothetical protein
LEDPFDGLPEGGPFQFELGAQDQAVFEHGLAEVLDVVGGDEVASGKGGPRSAGEQE